MPVVIENRATAFDFSDAATIAPSNFEAISFAVFNNTCEIEVWNMPQGSFQQGDWGGVLLTAPGQVTLNRCGGVRFRCARTNGLAITAVTQSPGAVTVAGDATTAFQAGFAAVIHGSTGNDGSYTVASAAISGTNTVVTFTTNLPSATANGSLYACAQILAYAWKDDEVQIASTTASSGNLAGSGFSPFSAAGPVPVYVSRYEAFSDSPPAYAPNVSQRCLWFLDKGVDLFDLSNRRFPLALNPGVYIFSCDFLVNDDGTAIDPGATIEAFVDAGGETEPLNESGAGPFSLETTPLLAGRILEITIPAIDFLDPANGDGPQASWISNNTLEPPAGFTNIIVAYYPQVTFNPLPVPKSLAP